MHLTVDGFDSDSGNFWLCIKISENLTNIKAAAQLRKPGLFPFTSQLA